MSDVISMVRLLHGMLYPAIGRCQNKNCYLGRNLPGLRFETGATMLFVIGSIEDHGCRTRLDPKEQRTELMELLRVDGANVVRFDARGVMVVSPKEGP